MKIIFVNINIQGKYFSPYCTKFPCFGLEKGKAFGQFLQRRQGEMQENVYEKFFDTSNMKIIRNYIYMENI